jgi:predicted molibdopterin-dependent oxidoreductase YjgC
VSRPRLRRAVDQDRPEIAIELDGKPVTCREGDTVLTAVLTVAGSLREFEFGEGGRAGFCLMGACQDCWVWTAEGGRLRACTTLAEPGMRIATSPVGWP